MANTMQNTSVNLLSIVHLIRSLMGAQAHPVKPYEILWTKRLLGILAHLSRCTYVFVDSMPLTTSASDIFHFSSHT